MRAKKELRFFLSVAAIVLLLAFGFFSYAQQQDTAKSSVPVLSEVSKRFLPKTGERPREVSDLPDVEKRFRPRPEWGPQEAPSLSEIEKKFLPREGPSPLSPPQLPEVGWPEVREFKDFKGGLDLSPRKTNIPPNRATYLMNALWDEGGGLYMRPDFDTLVITPEEFNFLYRYYQQDGDKYLMGGSDTALYFWQEDSTSWTYLAGTAGTSGRWDGAIFEDYFIGTHVGVKPVIWNGDSIYSSTALEAGDSFFVEFSTMVKDTMYTDCGRFQSVFTLTSPPASFTVNQLVGYTFEWYKNTGSSAVQRMLVLSNTEDEIKTTLPCSLDLVPDKPERWCWVRPWFHSVDVDSGTSDSVTVCYDDPNFCCFRPGDEAPSVRLWDTDLDTLKLKRDWTQILAVTDSRGNVLRNYIGNYMAFGVTGGESWVTINGWMVACFDEASHYEIYEASSALDDEGIKLVETFDSRLWFAWTGIGEEQNKNKIIYSEISELGGLTVWLPEHHIYLTPGDGDYITGMKSLSDARYVDVPTHVLMVAKNSSSYKIVPTSTAGTYAFWYISTRVGCVSNLAMSVAEGVVLWPDQDGVWAWEQKKRPQSVSLNIDPIFESDQWRDSLEYVSAIYNPQDRHYYLSAPHFLEIDTTNATIWGFLAGYDLDSAGAATANDLFTHKIDSDGEAYGADINYNTTTNVGYVDITTDTLGRCVGVWRHNLDNNDIYLTRFNADDEQVGESLAILDGSRATHAAAGPITVDMDNDGNIIVCWVDDPVSGTDDIWCQYVDWTDGKVDTNFVVNSDWETNGYACGQVVVGMNTNGIAVVAWRDGREYDPETYDIYTQIYDVPDSAIGSNSEASGGVDYWSDFFTAIAVTADRYVVAWLSQLGGSLSIQKRVFNIDGTAQEDAVNVSSGTVNKVDPAVAINAAGNHVVTWSHYDSVYDLYDIFGMKYDGDNNAVGSSFEVSGGLSEVQQVSSAVAINGGGVFVVVWQDSRDGLHPDTYYRSYSWSDSLDTCRYLNTSPTNEATGQPEIDCPDAPYRLIDTIHYTLAYNIDLGAWSKESFSASAYAYQHGLTDTVKVIFAEDWNTTIQNYDVQADDEDDPVILTYQSPYLPFVQNPSWEVVMSYATLEAFLDTGEIYVYWYKDYSELVHVDTITCGTDCREEMQLPPEVAGHNISMKIVTGSEIEDFTLSGYWWEYLIIRYRK